MTYQVTHSRSPHFLWHIVTLVVVAYIASVVASADPVGPEAASVKDVFRIAPHGDCVVLPVSTHFGVYQFLVDTGASSTGYDTKLRHQLTQIAEGTTHTGMRFPIFEASPASIGSLQLRKSPVVTRDLSTFRKEFGHPIYGFIGMSDLRSRILQIDFDGGRCRFVEELDIDIGDPFDLEVEAGTGLHVVRIGVNPQLNVKMLIDTGFDGDLAIKKKLFDSLVSSDDIVVRQKISLSKLTGAQSAWEGSLKSLQLGPFSHSHISVIRHDEANLIGLGYLSRFFVTFDFPNKKMFLKPGREFRRKSWSNALGANVLLEDDDFVLHSVGEFTPAGEAKMAKGDVILEIDDRKASGLSLFEVRQLFSEAGKRRQIKFRRSNDVHEINVLLREIKK